MYLMMKLLHIVAVIAFLGIIRSDRLFALSGLMFMAFVAPRQRQLLALAQAGSGPGNFNYRGYASVARRWEIWGAAALLTPVAGLVLMVLKPVL